jgi:hypothetical protein
MNSPYGKFPVNRPEISRHDGAQYLEEDKMKRATHKILILTILIGLFATVFPLTEQTTYVSAASMSTVVYSNDFETAAGSEWSDTSTDTTPAGARKFLGQFVNGGSTLSLDDLPQHTKIKVAFDVYVIRSWDGRGPSGDEVFNVSVLNGPTLINTGFSNVFSNRQVYPGDYPDGDYPKWTGATETDSLGYVFSGDSSIRDSVYHIERTFDHSGPDVQLIFSGSNMETLVENESWGLDNVVVTVLSEECAAPPDGLVSWYRAEANTQDSAGTNHGTFQNVPPTQIPYSAGKVGSGFALDQQKYVRIPGNTSLRPASWTLETWVLSSYSIPPASGDVDALITYGSSTDSTNGFFLGLLNGKAFAYAGSFGSGIFGTTDILSNRFHHLAATFDGSILRLYVNGIEEMSAANIPPPSYDPNADVLIGADTNANNPVNYFRGVIDEASIYSRALSASEIHAIFSAGSAGKCPGQEPCPAITLGPSVLSGGTVGEAYGQNVSASGGAGPYTYTVTGGALPAGLSLNANTGEITGMPAVSGSNSFAITATDANGCTGSQEYSIEIACPAVIVSPSSLPNGTVGTAYEEVISAGGTGGSFNFAVSGGALPDGLTLSSGGSLSGTPTASGTFDFSVTAADTAAGCSGSRQYSVTVDPVAIVFRCPRSQGYWKNNPQSWPVSSLVLGAQAYTMAELLNILNTPIGSGRAADASIILAHQLIAAKLNVANGADPAPVSNAIADGDALLTAYAGKLPYRVRPSTAAGQNMVNKGAELESYNIGSLTQGCTP